MYNDNALSAIYADIARLNKARVQIYRIALIIACTAFVGVLTAFILWR